MELLQPFRGFSYPCVRVERRDCREHIKKRNTPTFCTCQVAPSLHKHYLYPIKSISNRNRSFKLSWIFIKSTFTLEIIYSIMTTYQIGLTHRFRPMGIFSLCGQCAFLFFMCCRQSVFSPEGLIAVYILFQSFLI